MGLIGSLFELLSIPFIIRITLLIAIISKPSFSSFTIGSSLLPSATNSIAVGYDIRNDTVLLFGGYHTPQQFTMFKNNVFINVDSTFLQDIVQQMYGSGQYYTQLNDVLWIIDVSGTEFVTINTKTYFAEIPSITIVDDVDDGGCITSIDDYLILIGGGRSTGGNTIASSTVQIFDISANEWLLNVPSLNEARAALACVVVYDNVYAIGGVDGVYQKTTIETLDISNIAPITSTWGYFGDVMNRERCDMMAVVHGTDIYVIGGYDGWNALSTVEIIDTINDACEYGPQLQYPVEYPSCIIVRDTLFVFGGGNSEDRYQYLILSALKATTITPQNPSSTVSSQTRIETSTHRSTDAPFEYITTNAILSSYEAPIQTGVKTTIETTIETTIDGSTNVSSSFLTQYALKSISSTEEQNNAMVLTTSTIQSESTEDKSKTSSSLSPITIVIIVSTSSCFVLFIVYVFGKICYSQISEKRLIEVIDNNGEESRTVSGHNNDNNKDTLPVTIEGQKDDIIKPHDQEDAEKVQETIDCTVNNEPQTVSGGFCDV